MDVPAELSFSVKDGAIPSQYLRLKVTLKLVKDGIKDADARDIDFTSLLSVAIIKLVDDEGIDVQDLSIKNEDLLKLKKLLTGREGDMEEIVFEGEFHNSDDAPKWFDETTHFTPYLTGDIVIHNENAMTDEESTMEENNSAEGANTFAVENVLLPSQLKGKVEVINAEKSVSSYGYPEMTITFKLLSRVDATPLLSEYGQMWIIGIGQTENGVDVKELLPNYREWRTDDSEGKDFKEFLESDAGETITMEFTGGNESSQDVNSDLGKVKKFKLKLTN